MADPDPRSNSIARIRISIVGSEPEIWRLLEVSSGLSLAELHEVIQVAFGWRDSHLHQFTAADGQRWADERWIEEGEDGEDEQRITLAEVLDEESGPLTYEYDFGDGWIHQVELIELVSDATSPRALLVRGERRGPLEDSGGIHAYTEKLRILASPEDPQHVNVRTWIDVALAPAEIRFDPDALDVGRVNRALARRS